MLDHISIGTKDYDKARRFYDEVLGALGYKRVMEFAGHACAYGPAPDKPVFWVGKPQDKAASPGVGAHVCFAAPSREAVAAFHAAGLAAGGRDEGAPGLRTDYHPNYYAAFLFDPDGNKIEAVCHAPA